MPLHRLPHARALGASRQSALPRHDDLRRREWGFGAEEPSVQGCRYLERGGNFLDTANIYTKGHSEAIIGNYFAKGGECGRDRM